MQAILINEHLDIKASAAVDYLKQATLQSTKEIGAAGFVNQIAGAAGAVDASRWITSHNTIQINWASQKLKKKKYSSNLQKGLQKVWSLSPASSPVGKELV